MIGWLMNVGQFVEWELAGETEVLREIVPNATSSTINLIWSDLDSIPSRRGGKSKTNSQE
jgi:hypothetical protein